MQGYRGFEFRGAIEKEKHYGTILYLERICKEANRCIIALVV